MTEQEVSIYSIAYRDCKEVSDNIDVNEEVGKASAILFYMDEILEALKIASELQAIGTLEEFKVLKEGNCTNNCKHYDSAVEYIRKKAIDEFAEKLKAFIEESMIPRTKTEECYRALTELQEDDIDEIAEQMKGGAK